MSTARSIYNRTNLAAVVFAEEDRDIVERYIERLLTSWRDVSTALQRSMVLLVLMITAFEVVNRQPRTSEVAIAFVKFSDPYVVIMVLPLLVAFFQYLTIRNLVRWRRISNVFEEIMQEYSPAMFERGYDSFLAPQAPLVSTWTFKDDSGLARATRFQRRTELVATTAIIVGLPFFHVYAYWQVLLHYGFRWAALVSLGLAVTLNVYYLRLLVFLGSQAVSPVTVPGDAGHLGEG